MDRMSFAVRKAKAANSRSRSEKMRERFHVQKRDQELPSRQLPRERRERRVMSVKEVDTA